MNNKVYQQLLHIRLMLREIDCEENEAESAGGPFMNKMSD